MWQIDCSDTEPAEERVERVLAGLPAAAADADLLVLPELWPTGAFNLTSLSSFRAPDDLPHRLGAAAAAAGVWLHAGSVPLGTADDSRRTFNASLLFEASGNLCASYRKRHLFGWEDGERTVIAPGADLALATTPLGQTGLATCYDLRFPEMFRDLVALGADSFLIPAGWPVARMQHWWILNQARAIENQALVVACNARGRNGDVVLGGGSMVVDARGEVVAQGGPDDEFVDAVVDVAATAAWRAEFPALHDRL